MQGPNSNQTAKDGGGAGRRRRGRGHSLTWSMLFLLLAGATSLSEAIVKQQSQVSSSSASSPASSSSSSSLSSSSVGSSAAAQQAQQQQRSDNIGQDQQTAGNNQVTFNNHQVVGGAQSQGRPNQMQMDSLPAGGFQGKPYANADQMTAAASNSDQSYQAAAQSVNMALASSGISPTASGQQQSSAGQPPNSGGNLNPLHYFYYPAAKESSVLAAAQGVSAASGQQQSGGAGAANKQDGYLNSMNAYQSYADQLNSALAPYGSSSPDAAASNPDPSYLPQPMLDQQQQQQQQQMNNNQQQYYQQGNQQQHQQQAHNNMYNGNSNNNNNNGIPDLSSFSSNINSAAAPAPLNQPQVGFNGQPSGGASNDFMNSHASHQMAPQQQPQQGFQGGNNNNNLFNSNNQIPDLSTSNFGNNPGGMSASVAAYLPPGSGGQSAVGDMFGGQSSAQQSAFNSAASSLSPASIAPTGGAAAQFNPFAALGQPQQQPQQQQLFSGQNYLNSFLTPQQYAQLLAQQQQQVGSPQQAESQVMSSQTSAAGAASSTGKRFGISSLIMPVLALAGLSLLIPTMSNLPSVVGRKKRSIVEESANKSQRRQQIAFEPLNGASQLLKESSIGEYMDKIERYYSIYRNAVESDSCLNRLICELGDAVKDVAGRGAAVSVIEKLVPNWMSEKMHLFKEAAASNESGKEKCKRYVCNSGASNAGAPNRQH